MGSLVKRVSRLKGKDDCLGDRVRWVSCRGEVGRQEMGMAPALCPAAASRPHLLHFCFPAPVPLHNTSRTRPRTLRVKVVRNLSRQAGHVIPALHAEHAVLHAQQRIQHVAQLDGANPVSAQDTRQDTHGEHLLEIQQTSESLPLLIQFFLGRAEQAAEAHTSRQDHEQHHSPLLCALQGRMGDIAQPPTSRSGSCC